MKFPGFEPMGLEKDLITGSFLPQELGHPTSARPHDTIKILKSIEFDMNEFIHESFYGPESNLEALLLSYFEHYTDIKLGFHNLAYVITYVTKVEGNHYQWF
ncbi:hypothetical protein PCASD_04245 [Puccinia coronata f. sp. avenae]|uniref:Uncharacterized protein n=1 Tax=Puccinia coronata f. sp. avenae TaxID=200324 RepID=A0A2N5VET3_9BASI|nr:hypothetical protein PCASD_04245 [Puccinia coronata f. sp. avenae]